MQNNTSKKLFSIFNLLLSKFGKRYWWPGETQLEVVFGCILTQNVTWKNVQDAIIKLKANNLIDIENIINIDTATLAQHLISTRYYNQKAVYLQSFCQFLKENYEGSLDKLFLNDIGTLRKILLSLKGIGKETADSIILYSASKPIFVVDLYTKRIFSRMGFFHKESTYDEVQKFFESNIPHDLYLFNEFHALIVLLAQISCKSSKPNCSECVVKQFCNKLI